MINSCNDENFENEVINSDIPVIVDFWAEWCQPCKQFAPSFEDLANDFVGKIKFVKFNIDEAPETPTKYGVRGIPNLILFNNGEIVDSKVGAISKELLADWLNDNIK